MKESRAFPKDKKSEYQGRDFKPHIHHMGWMDIGTQKRKHYLSHIEKAISHTDISYSVNSHATYSGVVGTVQTMPSVGTSDSWQDHDRMALSGQYPSQHVGQYLSQHLDEYFSQYYLIHYRRGSVEFQFTMAPFHLVQMTRLSGGMSWSSSFFCSSSS